MQSILVKILHNPLKKTHGVVDKAMLICIYKLNKRISFIQMEGKYMKKSIIALSLSAIMLLTMVTGCSSGSNTKPSSDDGGTTTTETPKAPEAGGTVSILASSDWVKDPEFALAEKFTEETGIEIDYQIVPADQYPSLLMTKLNSGECADIFMNQSGALDIESQLQIMQEIYLI